MARFVVDSSAVLRLAKAGTPLPPRHRLLAPTLLRSQTLSALHEAVARGQLSAAVARERLAQIARMPIRLLGDAVLRQRAWDIADQLALPSTYDAEYLALTQLQADAFITLDEKLARKARAVVTVAAITVLTPAARRR